MELNALLFLVLEEITGKTKTSLLIDSELTEDPAIMHNFDEAIARLEKQEPVQYILGKAHFYGRDFRICRGVLVPRPETEELVKWIIDDFKASNDISILDIGTGSGCIALTLALELPRSMVSATDFSNQAILVARENAGRLSAETDIFHFDILKNFSDQEYQPGMFDVIVSNPPYIPASEKSSMPANVTDWEPPEALFVADSDPLVFYRRILRFGADHLNPCGKIYFEIHEKFGGPVRELCEEFGYSNVLVRIDINGKNRMVRANYNG